MRRQRKEKKEAIPDMASLLDARDYTGAITLIDFERKIFMDKKQASGWRSGAGGEYQWVEGGSASLTMEEAKQDEERVMWLAYAAFHLGNYQQALDSYQSLLDKGSDDAMLHVYMGCCLSGSAGTRRRRSARSRAPRARSRTACSSTSPTGSTTRS